MGLHGQRIRRTVRFGLARQARLGRLPGNLGRREASSSAHQRRPPRCRRRGSKSARRARAGFRENGRPATSASPSSPRPGIPSGAMAASSSGMLNRLRSPSSAASAPSVGEPGRQNAQLTSLTSSLGRVDLAILAGALKCVTPRAAFDLSNFSSVSQELDLDRLEAVGELEAEDLRVERELSLEGASDVGCVAEAVAFAGKWQVGVGNALARAARRPSPRPAPWARPCRPGPEGQSAAQLMRSVKWIGERARYTSSRSG